MTTRALTLLFLSTVFSATVPADARPRIGQSILEVCAPSTAAGAEKRRCLYSTIQQALNKARSGDSVVLEAGIYEQCAVIEHDNVTLVGAGAVLRNTACQGKGSLVVNGDNVLIRDIACSGISVPSENGACVRLQGKNLRLENVRFANSEDGLLGGLGNLSITGSLFMGNGYKGQAHQLYFSGDYSDLIIRNSSFLAGKGQGHGIKSGAKRLVLDGVVIDGSGGRMSRNIDAYNGGELIIRNSLLRKSASDANRTIIGYDYEERVQHAVNRIILTNNIFDCGKGAYVLLGDGSLKHATIVAQQNTYIGNCLERPTSN